MQIQDKLISFVLPSLIIAYAIILATSAFALLFAVITWAEKIN